MDHWMDHVWTTQKDHPWTTKWTTPKDRFPAARNALRNGPAETSREGSRNDRGTGHEKFFPGGRAFSDPAAHKEA